MLFVNDVDEDNLSLLRDNFDEEESSRSFQQALTEWRAGNTHADREHHEHRHSVQTAQPGNKCAHTHTCTQTYILFTHVCLTAAICCYLRPLWVSIFIMY